MPGAAKPVRPVEFRARLSAGALDDLEFARLAWGAADGRWAHRNPSRAEFLGHAARLALRRANVLALAKGIDLVAEVAKRATPRDARHLAKGANDPSECAADATSPGESLSEWLHWPRDEGMSIR